MSPAAHRRAVAGGGGISGCPAHGCAGSGACVLARAKEKDRGVGAVPKFCTCAVSRGAVDAVAELQGGPCGPWTTLRFGPINRGP